jgi:hypothetical protein
MRPGKTVNCTALESRMSGVLKNYLLFVTNLASDLDLTVELLTGLHENSFHSRDTSVSGAFPVMGPIGFA